MNAAFLFVCISHFDIDRHVPHCRTAQKHFHRHSFDASVTYTHCAGDWFRCRRDDSSSICGYAVMRHSRVSIIFIFYQNNNEVAKPPADLTAEMRRNFHFKPSSSRFKPMTTTCAYVSLSFVCGLSLSDIISVDSVALLRWYFPVPARGFCLPSIFSPNERSKSKKRN